MSFINWEIKKFSAQAYERGEFRTITKEDLLGHWSVIFFYPADFTFVCPTELGDLQEHYETFQSLGCEIYSVSCDTHFVHKAWADASDTIAKVTYPMIADPTAKLAKMFEVYLPKEGQALRGSFILNPQGVVKAYEVHDNGIGRNASELLRKLEAAQFVAEHGDEVCPANWKPGEETLMPSLDLIGML
jgi:peroxiredoxin